MLDQPTPDIGAVFDTVGKGRKQAGDPQFLAQAAHRTGSGVFVPARMGAAGIRPQSRRMILRQRPLLDQHPRPVQHKDRHRLVAQPFQMHVQFSHRLQPPVDPGGDHLLCQRGGGNRHGHRFQVQTGDTSRKRCAMFFIPIFTWAIGRAFTSFLFI